MNSLPSELQLDLFELACVNQRGGLTILARLNSNYKALVTPLLHASLLIRSIEDVQLFTSQKIEFDLVQLIEIRSELSLESCQLLKEMIEKMINLRSVDTVTLIDSSVYSTIKESCKRLENFKITISGKRPDEEEIYLEKLCCFENLKQFEFVAEAVSERHPKKVEILKKCL